MSRIVSRADPAGLLFSFVMLELGLTHMAPLTAYGVFSPLPWRHGRAGHGFAIPGLSGLVPGGALRFRRIRHALSR